MNVVSGLHEFFYDGPELPAASTAGKVQIQGVRRPRAKMSHPASSTSGFILRGSRPDGVVLRQAPDLLAEMVVAALPVLKERLVACAG